MGRNQWPKETLDAVLDLYKSGFRSRRIQTLTGVPTMTILTLVRDHGLLPARVPGDASAGLRCTNITGQRVCNELTSEGRKQCDACLSKRTKQRRDRASRGFCQDCGNPATQGRAKCDFHNQASNEWRAALSANRKAAGHCVTCGNPDGGRASKCDRCWFRGVARQTLGSTAQGDAIRAIFLGQNGRCVYTGEVLVPGVNASLDHKIPKSLGGSNDVGNLQWVTKEVNTAKWDRTEDQFLELCRKIVSHRGDVFHMTTTPCDHNGDPCQCRCHREPCIIHDHACCSPCDVCGFREPCRCEHCTRPATPSRRDP